MFTFRIEEELPLFPFFLKTSALLLVLGLLLSIGGFILDFSFWYGGEMVKSGMCLLLIGLFLNLMEHNKRET